LQNFFREPTLVALRELALREAAHEVEQRIATIENVSPEQQDVHLHHRKDQKILVYLTSDPKTAMVTRRAKRVSDFLGVECFAVAVQPAGSLNSVTAGDREAIERHLNFARNLHIETRTLEGKDPAALLLDFARRNHVTQIFVSRPRASSLPPLLGRDPVQKLIGMAKDMQIVIVSDRDPIHRRR
jgi:two-component system sensor histidine kinase KdpD